MKQIPDLLTLTIPDLLTLTIPDLLTLTMFIIKSCYCTCPTSDLYYTEVCQILEMCICDYWIEKFKYIVRWMYYVCSTENSSSVRRTADEARARQGTILQTCNSPAASPAPETVFHLPQQQERPTLWSLRCPCNIKPLSEEFYDVPDAASPICRVLAASVCDSYLYKFTSTRSSTTFHRLELSINQPKLSYATCVK